MDAIIQERMRISNMADVEITSKAGMSLADGLVGLTNLMEAPPEFYGTDILKEETISSLTDGSKMFHDREEGLSLKIPEIHKGTRKQQ